MDDRPEDQDSKREATERREPKPSSAPPDEKLRRAVEFESERTSRLRPADETGTDATAEGPSDGAAEDREPNEADASGNASKRTALLRRYRERARRRSETESSRQEEEP